MKVELRNVKYAGFASEETDCFRATVYIDGERAGEVSNDGKGGCDMHHPFALEKRLEEWAKTLPPYDASRFLDKPEGSVMKPHSAETAIGELLSDWLAERDVKRAMKARVLYTKVGKKGIYQTSKLPPERIAHILANPKQYIKDVSEVLNNMDIAMAVRHYREAAR